MNTINGKQFASMVLHGANNLTLNADYVDALNVFPVPDGDTGTNMNLSLTSGAKEVAQNQSDVVGKVAASLAKGLLMGARGNSGVILSQLFRGFAKSVEGKEAITTLDFAMGMKAGVDTAYKAVLKPVEGTILTVARESAEKSLVIAKKVDDFEEFLTLVVKEANISLQKTPDLLPVLKEVGVVDSGGQGLVCIYEGFLANVRGEELTALAFDVNDTPKETRPASAQGHLKTEDIEFGYCTEFMIKYDQEKLKKNPYDETKFRNELSHHGDSLLVVSDENLIKVHIHSEYPGDVLTKAQRFGDLINIKIENMREQHSSLLFEAEKAPVEKAPQEMKPFGIVSVGIGSGVVELFKNLGVTEVIEGGQTMNPSTEDIINAVKKTNAKHVYVLPNNKNIIMAAKQAADVSEVGLTVIETKSIPQGLSAVLAFNPQATPEENKETMTEAAMAVKTGLVTFAVRDTQLDGVDIKKDDYMGIAESKIVVTNEDKVAASIGLLDEIVEEDSEILTIITGEDATDEEVSRVVEHVEDKYEDIEVEVYKGEQPLYSFIFSLE